MTLLLSPILASCLALVHTWRSTIPALHITIVPESEVHQSSKVSNCKSCKQHQLAFLSPWSLDTLCSTSSGVRASDISEADLVISVSNQVRDSTSQPVMESEREASAMGDICQSVYALSYIIIQVCKKTLSTWKTNYQPSQMFQQPWVLLQLQT
ncbi:unnamed protein product [Staurois parvus]|uniref:Uncharacterized protein n=1 Tax=Staurois parvus TaxID=386267 RepID=A0ABN9DR70_9NEOB|nr:unnamed protein product [Staurois parvus]